MKKLLLVAGLILAFGLTVSRADEPAFFTVGPLSLQIPLKTVRVVYLYDFLAKDGQGNLVGGETPVVRAWDRVEGTFGAVTSLEGQGTPFLGGNLLIGNLLDKWVTLPADLSIGGFGGWNFRNHEAITGFKASTKLW